jgi:hypothetical protein|nr:MAG TPA: hypothetical protein [Caudoviricetes sp.]
MNAIEFEKIMKSEGLRTTRAVMVMLQEAKQCQKNIKAMSLYKHLPYAAAYIEQQKEQKDKAIWQALEVAQLEKLYGFRLIEDRNSVIIATYNVDNPHSEVMKKIRRDIEIMAELEKEYGICD